MLPLITETEVKFLEYIKTCYERLEECQFLSKLFNKNYELLQDPLTRAKKALTGYHAQSRLLQRYHFTPG